MTEEEQFNHIDQYINGKLSDAETKAFEQQIQANPSLAEEVALHQELGQFLSDTQGIALEAQLTAVGEQFSQAYQQKNTPKSGVSFYWIAAAGLLLFLSIAWWFTSPKSSEELFAAHYETYVSDELERSNNTISSPLEEALKAYSNKNYPTAQKQFKTQLDVSTATPNNSNLIRFHLAMIHMEQKEYAPAQTYLNKILANDTSLYHQQAHWFLALIQLKTEQPQAAKQSLQQVLNISSKGKYAHQAKQLLQEF